MMSWELKQPWKAIRTTQKVGKPLESEYAQKINKRRAKNWWKNLQIQKKCVPLHHQSERAAKDAPQRRSQMPRWRNGRRARFRCVCREACRFESCSGHYVRGLRKQLSWQSITLPRLGSRVRVSFSAQKKRPVQKYIDLFYLSWRECRKRKKVKSINIDIPSSRCFSQIIRNGNIY